MTQHSLTSIEQSLSQGKIIQSHQLNPADIASGDTTLDIRLNQSNIPAANDAQHDRFIRYVSDELRDKIADVAGVEPSEVWFHDDTDAPNPTISFTFEPNDWAIAEAQQNHVTHMLDGMAPNAQKTRDTPTRRLFDKLINVNSSTIYDNVTCDTLNDDPKLKSEVIERLEALHITSPTFINQGTYSLVLEQEGLDDMVVRLTSEKREEQYDIPQILQPLMSEQVGEHMWLEIMPKVKTKGITNEHKNALEQSLQSQHNRHLLQDDIGLLSLTDGTELPICYDTTNVSDVDAPDKEQWTWRDPSHVQQYDWENPALAETYEALKEKLDAYTSRSEGKHVQALRASENTDHSITRF